jgi:hypothetical protein
MKLIELSGSGKGLYAQVDDEDYEYLTQWKWNIGRPWNIPGKEPQRYAKRRTWIPGIGSGPYVVMHRVVMGITDGNVLIDHIDRDSLNNQKSNLRIATWSQNMSNVGPKKKGKYKGVEKVVYKTNQGDKIAWRARCMKDRKGYYGSFCKTEEEAALSFNELCKKLHGEYVYLNVIKQVPDDNGESEYLNSIREKKTVTN